LQEKLGPGQVLRPVRYGLLLAVSIAALSGCVSAVSTDMRAENVAAPVETDVAAAEEDASPAAGTMQERSAAVAADGNGAAEAEPDRDMAGLVMQPTTLNAGQASIYSTGGETTVPAYATQSGVRNAAVNSIYASSGAGEGAAEDGRLPVEDMPAFDPSTQRRLPLAGDDRSAADPETVPVDETARTALVDDKAAAGAAGAALDRATAMDDAASPAQATGRKKLTLSSLFGAKRQAAGQLDSQAQQSRRVLNRDNVGAVRTASLGMGNLPGVSIAGMPASDTHSEAEEAFDEDGPRFKEVASLAGLARLAPNGLWLQTEKVDTGCFKPELLDVLKSVEQHYGKPVIVTSGLRNVKRNREKQSLHTRCAAADIQIAGVGKWELAEYLRSMPGRGGVGTYCHTESVHIDIGPERDWNWRCRRRK